MKTMTICTYMYFEIHVLSIYLVLVSTSLFVVLISIQKISCFYPSWSIIIFFSIAFSCSKWWPWHYSKESKAEIRCDKYRYGCADMAFLPICRYADIGDCRYADIADIFIIQWSSNCRSCRTCQTFAPLVRFWRPYCRSKCQIEVWKTSLTTLAIKSLI